MKTKRKTHDKIFIFLLSASLLLLLALSVGTTLGKFTLQETLTVSEKNILIQNNNVLDDPENPDRPGIEESAPTDVYEVQPGDTLASIAEEFHISVDSLAACNSLSPSVILSPGTVLRIPSEE